jgi:sec-independent protein translocase protein TatB
MFNVGAGEVLVILLVALIVLGPDKLPKAAKQVGQVMGDLRRMSAGFQRELRNALDEPMEPSEQRLPRPEAPPAAAGADTPVEPRVADTAAPAPRAEGEPGPTGEVVRFERPAEPGAGDDRATG